VCDTPSPESMTIPVVRPDAYKDNSLDGHVHSWDIESLKHDLGHALAVGFRVERSLGEQNWVLFGCDAELIVKSVMPYLLHVIPIGDDAVLNWVLESQDTALALSFITDVTVLLVHANHDARHLWAADNGWEHRARCIITGEASFAHAATVVHHERGNFLVTHG